MFAIKKPGGGLRRIMDCRPLNTQLKAQHFTMNDLNKVLEIWKKNDQACLMDIKSAFNHVAVTGELEKYLAFTHRGIHYTQVRMPFGISIAPRTFAKTIHITIDRMRSKSPVRIVNYADDILFLMQNQHYLEKEIEWIVQEFKKFGQVVNENKSRLKPDQQFVFLGWMFNSATMEIQLTNEKRKELKAIVQRQIMLIMEQQPQKIKKRGKFGWQAPILNSVIQTRRTTSIANKQVNEQSCEGNVLDKRNDSNQEVLDRVVLVEESGVEQQTKNDRQGIELDNNIDRRVNIRLWSECEQKQHTDQKDIRIVGSGDGEFKHQRDTSNIEGNLNTQRISQPIGIQLNNDRNRQYNRVFLNSKSKSKITFEESDRFDFINRRGKWMDINNKTYRWEIEQRSGRVVKVVDGGGLRNKEGSIRGGFKGLVSWDNSGFIRSKEQCQTQEILYIGQRQESGRMRFNESLL
ncbi:MAG: putative reverse transcriptase [Streblomastix strix]|uniref:Putative reverse transcriptase n=1 Tax=Streblomastix strix TaxID=222440 RepID=A0A5J4UK02_9EUKA|nr:MAG: putative reverse transcriptase [Streblomastix strix]